MGTRILLIEGDAGQLGCGKIVEQEETPQKLPLEKIVQISAGVDAFLALDSMGVAYAWGDGTNFNTGIPCNGQVGEVLVSPRKIELENVVDISMGGQHSCFITR